MKKVFLTGEHTQVIALLTPGGCRICKGNLPRWWGSGCPASTDGLARQGFPFTGLGIHNFGGGGLAKHGFEWKSADGPVKHCCLWVTGYGLGKHCCVRDSALCCSGGRFKWIGHTCSLVLQYFLPCASMM